MKLKALIQGMSFEANNENLDIEVKGIAYDSRKIKDEYIFVAIKGYVVDGHEYIESAIDNGAKTIILEELPSIKREGVVYIKVEDSRKALSLVSCNFFDDPSSKVNVIGITGTNGKSSICHMINDGIKGLGKSTGVLGTIGNFIGDKKYPTEVTTPESFEIHSFVNDMIELEADNLLMEVSSHSLDLARVEDIKFDVGVFTNLTRDHLDFHNTMENYYQAKKKLFTMTTKGNVINIDDEYGKRLYDELIAEGRKSYSYSINEKADFYADNIVLNSTGTNFTLIYDEKKLDLYIPIPGRIYVYNALATIASYIVLGYDLSDVKKAFEFISPVKGRLESVDNDRGISILVDYSHTPDSLKNVLLVSREFTDGRLISVFGCGGNRDKTKRPIMGRISEELADISIVTSDNPRFEEANDIIDDILEGMDSNDENVIIEPDRKMAIEKAISISKAGDSIVIAGKGHEDYQIIKGVKFHLDDREVVENYLKGGIND